MKIETKLLASFAMKYLWGLLDLADEDTGIIESDEIYLEEFLFQIPGGSIRTAEDAKQLLHKAIQELKDE